MDKLKTALLFPLMIILTALLVYLFFEIKSKSYNSHAQQAIVGDLDYIYSKPSMTLLNTETLKLSLDYEILNCYSRDEREQPVNRCREMNLVVVNEVYEGEREFSEPLRNGSECLGVICKVTIIIPLVSILSTSEHREYRDGKIVRKTVPLKLSYRDSRGARRFADHGYELSFLLNPTGFGTVFAPSIERIDGVCPLEIGNGNDVGIYVEEAEGYAWFNKVGTSYFFGVDKFTGRTKRSNGGLIYSDSRCENLVGEVFDYPLHLTGDIYVFPYECKWYEYPRSGYYGRYPLSGRGYYHKPENGECRFVNGFVPNLRSVQESEVEDVYERYTLPIVIR